LAEATQGYLKDQHQRKHPMLTKINQLVQRKYLIEKSLIETYIVQEALISNASEV